MTFKCLTDLELYSSICIGSLHVWEIASSSCEKLSDISGINWSFAATQPNFPHWNPRTTDGIVMGLPRGHHMPSVYLYTSAHNSPHPTLCHTPGSPLLVKNPGCTGTLSQGVYPKQKTVKDYFVGLLLHLNSTFWNLYFYIHTHTYI